MKQLINIKVILLALVVVTSCKREEKAGSVQVSHADTSYTFQPFSPGQLVYGSNYEGQSSKPKQIAEYVRRIFEDSRGDLWFATNAYGVCRYDGDTLVYFSTPAGLSGRQVTGILEDRRGRMWFSTTGGVSMFDGKGFTNFTEKDGLSSKATWSIYEDSRGTIWAGTEKGLCRYVPEKGGRFSQFTLPQADVANPKPRFSTKLVSSIMEDKNGNLWFGTDGVGVYKYDPSAEENGTQAFTHLSMKDGLSDNSIVCIIEDREGHIWFSTRFGGLSRYNPSAKTAAGESFTHFTVAEGDIGNNEVWTMYEDRAGTFWFSSEGYGMYRFKDNQLTNFGKEEGLPILAVQSIFEDTQGRLWVGGGNGLYFLEDKKFIQFTRQGPLQGC